MRAVGLLLVALLLAARPGAAADFFDCTAEDSAQLIDPGAPFTCVVLASGQAPLRNGSAPFRVVGDATSDAQALAPLVAIAVDTVKANTAAWSAVYDFTLLPLTVVLFDPNDALIPIKQIYGRHQLHKGQCLVRLNTKGLAEAAAGPEVVFRRTLAHELVHCLQRSNWSDAMDAEGNDWWREGAADMLSAVLYPLTVEDTNLQIQFDAQSSVVPLTRMSYEAATFFHWLWGREPALVFGLMAAMPGESGEAAQRAALLEFIAGEALGVIGERGLDRFAQDYLDGAIRDPRGMVIVAPDLGPPIIFDETRSVTFSAEPFTIQRALLGFIGDFALPTFDALGTIWARPAEGDWDELPLFLDQEGCEQPQIYRVGRMPIASSDHGFRLDANQTETCEICRVTQEQDDCLVGSWSVDLQAMTLDLRERIKALSGLSEISGSITFELRASGGFTAAFDQLFIGGVAGDGETAAAWWLEIAGEDRGTWSAANGVLTLCIHEPGSQMVNTIALGESQRYVTEHTGYAQSGVYSYACGQTTLLDYSGPLVMPPGYEPRWTLNKAQ